MSALISYSTSSNQDTIQQKPTHENFLHPVFSHQIFRSIKFTIAKEKLNSIKSRAFDSSNNAFDSSEMAISGRTGSENNQKSTILNQKLDIIIKNQATSNNLM